MAKLSRCNAVTGAWSKQAVLPGAPRAQQGTVSVVFAGPNVAGGRVQPLGAQAAAPGATVLAWRRPGQDQASHMSIDIGEAVEICREFLPCDHKFRISPRVVQPDIFVITADDGVSMAPDNPF